MVKQIVKQKNICLTKKRLFRKYKVGGAGEKKTISNIYKDYSKIYIVNEFFDKRKSLFNDDLYKQGNKDFVEIDGITYQIHEILPNKFDIVEEKFLEKYDKETDNDKQKYSIIESNKSKVTTEKEISNVFKKEISSKKIKDHQVKIESVKNRLKQLKMDISRMANSSELLTSEERDILSEDIDLMNDWLTEIEEVLKQVNTNVSVVLERRLDDIKQFKFLHKSKGRNLLKSKKCKQDNEKKVKACEKMDAIKEQIAPRIKLLGTVQSELEDISQQNDEIKLANWRADHQEDIDNDDSGIFQKALEEQTLLNIEFDKLSTTNSKKLIDEINGLGDIPALNAWEGEQANVDAIDALNNSNIDKVTSAIQTKREYLSNPLIQRLIDEINNIDNIPDLNAWDIRQANVDVRGNLIQAGQERVTTRLDERRTEISTRESDTMIEHITNDIANIPDLDDWNTNVDNRAARGNLIQTDQDRVTTRFDERRTDLSNTEAERLIVLITAASFNDLVDWEQNNIYGNNNLTDDDKQKVSGIVETRRLELYPILTQTLVNEVNDDNTITTFSALLDWRRNNRGAIESLIPANQQEVTTAFEARRVILSPAENQRLVNEVGDENTITTFAALVNWQQTNRDYIDNLMEADKVNVMDRIRERRTELSYGRKEGRDAIVVDATTGELGEEISRTVGEWLDMNPKNFIIVDIDNEIQYVANYDYWTATDNLQFTPHQLFIDAYQLDAASEFQDGAFAEREYPILFNTITNGDTKNWYWRCHEVQDGENQNNYRLVGDHATGVVNIDESQKYWKHPLETTGKYILPQWLEDNENAPGTRVFRRIRQPPTPFVSRKMAGPRSGERWWDYYGELGATHCQTPRGYFNLELVPEDQINQIFSHKIPPEVGPQEIQDNDPTNPLQFIFSGDNNLDMRTRARLGNWFGLAANAPNDRRPQLLAFASGNDVINRENTNAFKPIILDVNDQDQLNIWGDTISKLRNWIQNNPRAAFGRPINNWANPNQDGGKKKKKILVKKIVRKHSGIIQTGGNKGRLRKGYKFTGKKLKSGLPQIIKCRINKF